VPARSERRRSRPPLITVGLMLLMCAVLAALIVVALVYLPGRMITQRAEIGSTLHVEIPADRDMAVYTTLETWRAAECTLVGAEGESYELRPDMTQQRLAGFPTWYPQGSFEVDRAQPIAVTCQGPAGEFAVGRSVGLGYFLLRYSAGLLGVVLGVVGLIMLIVGGAARRNAATRSG
jgi:hypothetical protein